MLGEIIAQGSDVIASFLETPLVWKDRVKKRAMFMMIWKDRVKKRAFMMIWKDRVKKRAFMTAPLTEPSPARYIYIS